MKPLAALAISVMMLFAQNERARLASVTAIRNWSLPDVTRIAVEVSGDFHVKTDRLHNPERVYFDIVGARPRIDPKPTWSKELSDKRVQRVRVAKTTPGTTRIVLDLGASVEVSVSQLSNPSRLMIELRSGAGPAIPTETLPPAAKAPAVIKAETPTPVTPRVKTPGGVDPALLQERAPAAELKVEPDKPSGAPPLRAANPAPGKVKPAPSGAPAEALPEEPAASSAASRGPAQAATLSAEPPVLASPSRAGGAPAKSKPAPSGVRAEVLPAEPTGSTATLRGPSHAAPLNADAPAPAPPPFLPGEFSKGAKHTSSGGASLTRALGLKVGRIVIDAGHGGHDEGTQGPHGLVEKELVLDVATRVGKLVEERMNAEVIYTRSDDTFVPLEGRTAIATQRKADLFLSIHANSSPIPRIGGVETFYLNFSDSKDALDVAARENASSQKSIFELQDIIQKITLHEKLDESKEFAGRIQASLYAFSARNLPGQKNRGVKKAPFVVLIGADIPSVLVEIGFLSNSREESLLKKSDYRQKLAEALFRGVSKYAESLSHFQLAAN